MSLVNYREWKAAPYKGVINGSVGRGGDMDVQVGRKNERVTKANLSCHQSRPAWAQTHWEDSTTSASYWLESAWNHKETLQKHVKTWRPKGTRLIRIATGSKLSSVTLGLER